MCGVAALFAAPPVPLSPLIAAMTRMIEYRGPDDEGLALFRGPGLAPIVEATAAPAEAALGNRRLAIVDLSSSGHQPMASEDGRCWITFNGEIYNHIELRKELEALGCRFRSHTDTEVILHAYRLWGEKCLDRFNGMFAIVLVDREVRKLLAARDRFGVKPLYYWRSPQGLTAFASEIKQFSVLPGWRARVNGQGAYDFLNWGVSDHTGETMFEGVRQLRGGEVVHCALDELARGVPVRRWYELEPDRFAGSFDEAAERFRDLFTDSVRLRLRADVPVGSCLSGGLDSSSIVCAANLLLRTANAQAQQKTFSAYSRVARFDESRHIETVVRHTGVEGHGTWPDLSELFGLVDAITWHQDEPFGSTSIYAQWHVFRVASQARVKVLLDGQGADEQLVGYHGFFAPHFTSLFMRLRWLTLWNEIAKARELHGMAPSLAVKYIGNAVLPQPLRQRLRRFAGKPSAAPQWIDDRRIGYDGADPYARLGLKTTSIDDMTRAMLLYIGLPMLLHWEDRDSMAHSVESRLPFLDYRLVEFVMGLPADYRIAGATTKRVLREAMRGILPEAIRMRMDKLGFATPEEAWVRDQAPELFRAEARRAVEASRGILNARALARAEAIIDGREPFSFLLWRMISFGRWMERFGVAI